MNKETSKQARIINDALIAEYRQAVTKFNEEIKKSRYRQTLCENFISDWADVIEEIGIRNRKELEK
jgi:hypothetical protein